MMRPRGPGPPLAVLFWLFIVWGGCGLRDWETDLPNGYTMGSPWTGMVYIARNGVGHPVMNFDRGETVVEVGVQRDLVFGRLAFEGPGPRPSGAPPDPWFLLDTRTGEWKRFETRAAWAEGLRGVGLIGDPRLRIPGPWWDDLLMGSCCSACITIPVAAGLGTWLTIAARRRRERADARLHAEFNDFISRRAAPRNRDD